LDGEWGAAQIKETKRIQGNHAKPNPYEGHVVSTQGKKNQKCVKVGKVPSDKGELGGGRMLTPSNGEGPEKKKEKKGQ